MWPATMRTRADRLVRRRTFRVCTRSAGRFRRHRTSGPFRSLGTANRFQWYRLSSPRVKERSPRTVDGSRIRPTRPASPTSTFSHFFAPAGSIGSRRMEDAIRTGGPMAESCSISMRTGAMTAVPIDLTASFPGRVAKDAFSGWGGQHLQHVRGDQGWTAVPRQHRPQNAATATPLTVIVNWTSTLQK